MKKPRKIIDLLLIGCMASLIFLPTGCGKKGPPLPPIVKGNSIAAPYDLKYKVNGDVLTLTWKYQSDPENAKVIPSGFDIYLSQKTFKDCEGCPFKFDRIGFVEMPTMQYSLKIEKGYKYYLRVQAVSGDAMQSEYTRTVQFEYR